MGREGPVMEPRIQFTRTSDGVNIAYASFGDGPIVVVTSNVWGNLNAIHARLPQVRALVDEILAQGRRVITYDGRGQGSHNALRFSVYNSDTTKHVQVDQAVLHCANLSCP
jgi:pimeloyl-ACP methyl ester carboxylesterase